MTLTNLLRVGDRFVRDEANLGRVVAVTGGPLHHLKPLLPRGGYQRATVCRVLHGIDVQYSPVGAEAVGKSQTFTLCLPLHMMALSILYAQRPTLHYYKGNR